MAYSGRKAHRLYVVIIGFVTLLMVFLYGQIEYTREPYAKWDLAAYRAIALAAPQLDPTIPQPFAFRLLGPYVVGLLPLPDPLGFYILAVSASFGLVFLLYAFLCDMGVSAGVAALTTILFCFNKHLFGFTVWDFFQINDLLSLIYIIILFWTMVRGKWVLFGLFMLLGAMTRETVVLMMPVVFVYLIEKKKFFKEAGPALVAILLPAGVFLSLRLLIKAPGVGLLKAFAIFSAKLLSVETWFRLLINPFIPLSLLPLIYFERTAEFFRDKKYALLFILLVFASTLFGLNDERLMAPAFIVFYWLIAVIIDAEKVGRNKTVLSILILASFLASFHHEISRFNFLNRNVTVVTSLGALLIVTAVVLVLRIRYQRLET